MGGRPPAVGRFTDCGSVCGWAVLAETVVVAPTGVRVAKHAPKTTSCQGRRNCVADSECRGKSRFEGDRDRDPAKSVSWTFINSKWLPNGPENAMIFAPNPVGQMRDGEPRRTWFSGELAPTVPPDLQGKAQPTSLASTEAHVGPVVCLVSAETLESPELAEGMPHVEAGLVQKPRGSRDIRKGAYRSPLVSTTFQTAGCWCDD